MNALETFLFYKDEFRKYLNEHQGKFPVDAAPSIPFEEKHNVVHQERCCAYCRYAVPDLDNVCLCVHPDRIVRNEEGIANYQTGLRCNSTHTDVCDAWEELTSENADLGDPV